MAEAKTHRGTVMRNFRVLKDGVNTHYTADDTLTFDAGEYANYERAGLVRKPDPAPKESKADDKA